MNLEPLTDKHLQELERLLGELVVVMRKAKLHQEPEAELIRQLHIQMGETRRSRYDVSAREYDGY